MIHLRLSFAAINEHGLRLKLRKCFFTQEPVTLLGKLLDKDVVRSDPVKIQAIVNAPVPKKITELRSCIGLEGNYRRIIKNFEGFSAALHAGTSVKVSFYWSSKIIESSDLLM